MNPLEKIIKISYNKLCMSKKVKFGGIGYDSYRYYRP